MPGEQAARRRERRDRDVVLILDAVRALALEHADDLERDAVDLDGLADRVLAGEEVRHDGRADDEVALLIGVVLRGEERARRRSTRRAPRRTTASCRRTGSACSSCRCRTCVAVGVGHDRRDGEDVGRLLLVLERGDVLERQLLRRAVGAAAAAEAEAAARHDRERVRAEALDLAVDLDRGAVPDGDEHDHRGDADRDAEHRQQRAQAVRDQALHGHAQRLERGHAGAPCATRDAPASRAVVHEVVDDAAVAQAEDAPRGRRRRAARG